MVNHMYMKGAYVKVLFLILCSLMSIPVKSIEYVDFKIAGLGSVSLPLHIVSEQDQQRLESSAYYQPKSSIKLPSSLSLKSKFSAPKSQGTRDNCSAFVAIGLIEYYENGIFSEQCLSRLQHERDTELPLIRINWAIENGLYLTKDCPYYEKIEGRNIIPDLTGKSKFWPSDGYVEVSQSIDDPIGYIKNKINQGHPVIVSFYVAGQAWNRKGIIGTPTQKEIDETCTLSIASSPYKKCGAHASIVTGYDDDLQFLEFRNSWGDKWPACPTPAGDGYGKMSYDYFLKMRLGENGMVSR